MLFFNEQIWSHCGPGCESPHINVKIFVSSSLWKIANLTGGDILIGSTGPEAVKVANPMMGEAPHSLRLWDLRTMGLSGRIVPLPNTPGVKVLKQSPLPRRRIGGLSAHGAMYELAVARPYLRTPTGPVDTVIQHETVAIYYADKPLFCPPVLHRVPALVMTADCLRDASNSNFVLSYDEKRAGGVSFVRENISEDPFEASAFTF